MKNVDFIINGRNSNNLEDIPGIYMTNNTKNAVILGISVGAIFCSFIIINEICEEILKRNFCSASI